MNIHELDSYNLADAVKFNDKLNPVLWQGQHMRPEVRDQLLTIAEDFREHLGLANIDVEDITVSGSNAGYTYTPNSDIDLHLVVRMPHTDNEVYRELFDAKKYQYNDTHNITIGGYDVELYVEDASKPPVSQGVFSVLGNDWIHIPRQRAATVDDDAVRSKYDDLKHRIDSAVAGKNLAKLTQLVDKIKRMRMAGLATHGELGSENLAYKMLRAQGDIARLHDARNAAHDAELSLAESNMMPKPRMTYGFKSPKKLAEVEITPDGVSPGTKMFLSETDDESILRDFVAFCAQELELETEPQIRLRRDPAWSARNKTFGRYDHDTNQLEISIGNRHIMDVLRTCAHELTHQRQGETQKIAPDSGHTGSPEENEANAAAGIIMRKYGALHPELFEKSPVAESLTEFAPPSGSDDEDSGYGDLPYKAYENGRVDGFYRNWHADPEEWLIRSEWHKLIGGRFKQYYLLGWKKGREQKAEYSAKKQSVSEKINNDITHGNWHAEKTITLPDVGTLILRARNTSDVVPPQFMVDVYTPENTNKSIGHFRFLVMDWEPPKVSWFARKSKRDPYVMGGNVRVWDQYQKKGIAREVYKWIKDMGNDVRPSSTRTPAGKSMWSSFERNPLEEGTGYIPTAAEMHDPRFEMAITQDVRPGAIGRAANAFLLNTDAQGHPQELRPDGLVCRLAEQLSVFKSTITEAEQLDEINMSPRALNKATKSIDALAGMEFEMIVPNVEGGDYDGDEEPDYDSDESTYSIQGIVDFFDDGDYNSSGDIQRLREKLYSDYQDWLDTKISTAWDNEGFDFFTDWVANNIDGADINDWFKRDADHDITKSDVLDYANHLWGQDSSAKTDAYDEFRDDQMEDSEFDQAHWLDDEGLGLMSDIEDNYGISWPHWHFSGRGGGVYSIESVADSFKQAIGRPVEWGDDYHNVDRDTAFDSGAYIVEPDGSLEPDSSNDRGLEFISPPLPLDEIAKDLKKVKAWGIKNNCYTSKRNKTGLHINVSVPGLDKDMKNLDFVKLALLLGDKYVLSEFGRLSSSYAKSSYNIVMRNIRDRPESAEALLDRMRENLSKAASRIIHNAKTEKYTSINVKDGYIEFRGPGGDWLDDNFDKIQQTIERFVVATDAAVHPEKYRQEYLKKLHRALTGTEVIHSMDPTTSKRSYKIATEADFATLLSEYMSGRITRDELARVTVAQQQQRQDKPGVKQEYRMINPDTDAEYTRFMATSAEKAAAQAQLYAAEHDIAFYNYSVLDSAMQVVGGDIRHTATPGRHSDPNGTYEIVSRASGESAEPRFTFSVAPQQVPYVLQAWADRNGTTPDQWMVQDIDSGQEIPSTRPGYASTTGVDTLWSVRLRANMAQNVEVRAPNELSALAAAHEADPANFPMTLTTDDVIITAARDYMVPGGSNTLNIIDIEPDVAQNFPDTTWEIYRLSNPSVVYHTITAPYQVAAIRQASTLLARNGLDSSEFDIRPAAVPGSTQDLQQQRSNPGSFTGAWRVLDTAGREVWRFSGVGNVQADANRAAIVWLQNNGYDPAEYSVLPIVS